VAVDEAAIDRGGSYVDPVPEATVGPAKSSSRSSLSGPAIAKTGADTYIERDPDRDPVPKPTKPV